MNRRLFLILKQYPAKFYLGFIICSVFFICGCIVGVFSSGLIKDGDAVYNYIVSYMQIGIDGTVVKPQFISVLFNAFKYHILVIIFGFSLIGTLSIPLLSAFRGFCLSFSVSLVMGALSSKGIICVILIFGVSSLIELPCYFILASQSLAASQSLFSLTFRTGTRSPLSPYDRAYFVRCIFCFVLLLVSALISTFVIPYIFQLVV